MRKNLMSYLFVLLTGAAQKLSINREAYQEMTHLKMTLFYLRIIRTSRLLFISYLGIGICTGLFFISLILFHVTFFLYAPFSTGTKMWVGYAFAAVYLLIAAKTFSYIFTEDKWLSIFHAQNMFKGLKEEPVSPEIDSKQL